MGIDKGKKEPHHPPDYGNSSVSGGVMLRTVLALEKCVGF
jgi:hypothetical protein